MPSERSMPSEITGEKAERTKAGSISLQTWIRPFWMTVRVTGSRFDAGSDMALCLSQFGVAFHRSLTHRADFFGQLLCPQRMGIILAAATGTDHIPLTPNFPRTVHERAHRRR